MLRGTVRLLASKISGGHCKNQARPPHKKQKYFGVILDAPVTPRDVLREQRSVFGRDRFSRRPEFYPGANVRMADDFTLYAETKGVVSLRKSRINPAFKWVDVDPDIQKVRRVRDVRKVLLSRGEATEMVEKNEAYAPELDLLREPRWRERVMRPKPMTERFVDPNLFTRGVVDELKPMDRYCYE